MTTGWKGSAGAGALAAGLALLTACGATDPERGTAGPSSSSTSAAPPAATSARGPTPTEPPAPTVPLGPATSPTATSATIARTVAITVRVRGAGFCTHLPPTPSPACDPRPLPGVTVVVRDAGGATAATGVTDEGGRVVMAVPPGAHVVTSDPVPGFSEAARPASVDARPGAPVEVLLTHNTGFQ